MKFLLVACLAAVVASAPQHDDGQYRPWLYGSDDGQYRASDEGQYKYAKLYGTQYDSNAFAARTRNFYREGYGVQADPYREAYGVRADPYREAYGVRADPYREAYGVRAAPYAAYDTEPYNSGQYVTGYKVVDYPSQLVDFDNRNAIDQSYFASQPVVSISYNKPSVSTYSSFSTPKSVTPLPTLAVTPIPSLSLSKDPVYSVTPIPSLAVPKTSVYSVTPVPPIAIPKSPLYSVSNLPKSPVYSVTPLQSIGVPNYLANNQGVYAANVQSVRRLADKQAQILRQDSTVDGNLYRYSYQTDNGIAAEEAGRVEPNVGGAGGTSAQGYYEYVGDDGITYRVDYIADENGFRAAGAHLPTPPPIPEEIARSLAQRGLL